MVNEMIDKYIEKVSKILNIEKPKIIYDSSKFKTPTMKALCDGEKIYLKEKAITPDLMFEIAHELRHLWQIKTNKEFYFSEYKNAGTIDTETYNLQPAEIDAHAFAFTIMQEAFGIEPLFENMSERVREEIKKRAEEIRAK